jgi:hypothetical protein
MVKEKIAINGSIRACWFSVGIVVGGGFDPLDLKMKNDPAAWSHSKSSNQYVQVRTICARIL